ncbi:MAG: hypothetical protein JSR90_03960 [Proteobacteria bacterium]|nr:hypothetical protein [Pseudomonadota bacterium]
MKRFVGPARTALKSAMLKPATLVLGLAILLPGCAADCGATAKKLATLRRGMSYDETAGIMGCPGNLMTPATPGAAYAAFEWDGPESLVFNRTRIDFLDGKLLSYTTEQRGAL